MGVEGAANGVDGIKFFNRGDETPEIIRAAIDEAHKHKMGTVAHLSQNGVANSTPATPARRTSTPSPTTTGTWSRC